jgi:hypothetical protein
LAVRIFDGDAFSQGLGAAHPLPGSWFVF